jgi:hypothetical protein
MPYLPERGKSVVPEIESNEPSKFQREIYERVAASLREDRGERTPAGKRCVELTIKTMHTTSKAARAGYQAAAQWFALAARR